MLFIVATLALQAFSPALAMTQAQSELINPSMGESTVASSCASPDVDALVKNAAFPALPPGLKTSGTVKVAVTIAPNGHAIGTKVVHSSGNAAIDNAAVAAARGSTYSPKLVNCTPVEGHYLFRVDFAPSP